MLPLGSSHWLCRPWSPCSCQNHLHHFSYSLSTSYSLHHFAHSQQSQCRCGSHMAHRDSTWHTKHNGLGMHVQASDDHGNDPTSYVLLNLCMVYMFKGMEELSQVSPDWLCTRWLVWEWTGSPSLMI
jgi:hypothetical protein